MTDLQKAVSRLSGLLSPWASYISETELFGPAPDEPHAAFKQALIGTAYTALNVGETALSGHPVKLTIFSESAREEIERLLLGDPEQQEFLALVDAVQAVAVWVNRAAT